MNNFNSMTTVTPPPRHDAHDVADRLARLPLFRSTAGYELEEIAAAGTLVHVPAGWSPIKAQTAGDKAYIILEGQVEIRRPGGEVIELGAGDVIGEAAILQRRLRSATVVATTPLQVLHLTEDALLRLYAEVPGFRVALDGVLAQRAS